MIMAEVRKNKSLRAKYNFDSKEKSAARRKNERYEMMQLLNLLPLPLPYKDRMKDAEILCFVSTYIKARASLENYGDSMQIYEQNSPVNDFDGQLMLNSLNGFLLLLDMNGKVLYTSEHVSRFLKYQPTDYLSKNIIEHIAFGDDQEFVKHFYGIKLDPKICYTKEKLLEKITNSTFLSDDKNKPVIETQFLIKMNCNLSKYEKRKGTIDHAQMRWDCRSHFDNNNIRTGMVVLCTPMDSKSIMDIGCTDDKMFICRFNTDLKLTLVDPRLTRCLGYSSKELIHKNLYIYEHPDDHDSKAACTMNLKIYGRSVSKYYRLQAKNGPYIWIISQAYTIYDKGHQAVSYVTYNYVVSKEEGESYLKGNNSLGSPYFQNHGEKQMSNSAYAPVLVQSSVTDTMLHGVTGQTTLQSGCQSTGQYIQSSANQQFIAQPSTKPIVESLPLQHYPMDDGNSISADVKSPPTDTLSPTSFYYSDTDTYSPSSGYLTGGDSISSPPYNSSPNPHTGEDEKILEIAAEMLDQYNGSNNSHQFSVDQNFFHDEIMGQIKNHTQSEQTNIVDNVINNLDQNYSAHIAYVPVSKTQEMPMEQQEVHNNAPVPLSVLWCDVATK